MPLYFFHVWQNGQVMLDDDGIDLPSIALVLREAEYSARELLAAAIKTDIVPPDLISVYDDRQQKVAEVALRDLIPRSLR